MHRDEKRTLLPAMTGYISHMATHRSYYPTHGPQRHSGFRGESVPWQTWTELTIRVTGLPNEIGTLSLHQLLRNEGSIRRIDLMEDARAQRTGVAYVIFCPPPLRDFWKDRVERQYRLESDAGGMVYTLHISLEPPKRNFMHPSPVKAKTSYPERIVSVDSQLCYTHC